MGFLNNKEDWFAVIVERLPDNHECSIWSLDGDEILCKTEGGAEAVADLIEYLYKSQGEDVVAKTGHYDPEEDERNGMLDARTGWWYVLID